jgi:hypothetical protein
MNGICFHALRLERSLSICSAVSFKPDVRRDEKRRGCDLVRRAIIKARKSVDLHRLHSNETFFAPSTKKSQPLSETKTHKTSTSKHFWLVTHVAGCKKFSVFGFLFLEFNTKQRNSQEFSKQTSQLCKTNKKLQ